MSRDPISISEFRAELERKKEEARPHMSSTVVCAHCNHNWVAVFPAECGVLVCPACHQASAIPKGPVIRLLKPQPTE